LITRPHRACFIAGSAARVAWKTDVRLIAMIASHFSAGNASTAATCWMPALLTRMSMRPSSFAAFAHHVGDLGGFRHVGAVVGRPHAVALLEVGAQRLDLARVAEAVQHHVGALAREGLGDSPADAARRPGHHRRLSCELPLH
jgi:hypothetical protein